MKREPFVYSGSIQIFPPSWSIINWQIDKPIPVPWDFSSTRSKRLNIVGCFSNGMPQPVSVTENCAIPSSFCSNRRIILPSLVNLVALTKMLISTWGRRNMSVSISKEGSVVSKDNAACVCLIPSTV